MSSPPPATAMENDEVVETVDMEAPRPGEAAADHTLSSPHEVNDGPDEDEDMVDHHDESSLHLVNDGPDADVYMYDDHDEDGFAPDGDMDDDVDDVDDGFHQEGGKFSESAEVKATLEALWRKVIAVEEEKPSSAGHACPVCKEPLACEGAHRICCIPCGHVYGRSCLDKWLRGNGDETARCPQCAKMFADNHIINLYAPAANLWEGCGTIQEVKGYVSEAMAEVVVQCDRKMEATRAQASSKIAKLKAEQRSCDQQVYANLRELQDQMIEAENERREQIAEINYFLVETRANLKLINGRILSLPPKAKPAELQEGDAPSKDSRPRRIIKPNKRFYSNEWTR